VVAKPVELGLFLDPQTMATSAYSVGRAGNPLKRPFDQLQAWYFGENLPPMLVYDERVAQRYLEGIAAQINLPTVEATLTINGNDVVVTPGQVGRTLISEAVLPALEDQLRSLTDGMLPLVVRETHRSSWTPAPRRKVPARSSASRSYCRSRMPRRATLARGPLIAARWSRC
jgi:vancomycin resistance protein YoaR